MSNDRKQTPFTELVWESLEQNVAIPPRNSAEEVLPQLAPVPKIKTSSEDTVQLKLWDVETTQEPVTTTEGQFVLRAKELVQRSEAVAPLFIPFKSYWPTYGHMTGAQSNWYFYWRTEVRQGRFHQTDLSYIFLHVYELINGVGWEEPIDGYRQLCQLWEAYRDKYKRLDQYLGGWIADFSFVHKLDVPLSVIVARSRGLAGDLAELELMRCLSSAPEQLSFAVLTAMSDYDISKSKFYMGEGKEAAELYIPQVIALIDAYVTRKHGSNLIQMFPPAPPMLRERFLFRSAVYDISLYGYSVLVPVVRISKSVPLRSLITRLFRLTENKLRELLGYRGRLKGVNVDDDMANLVTRFLKREFHKAEQEEAGPAVVIDQGKLERLQTDSEIVRTLLTVSDTDSDTVLDKSDYISPAFDYKGIVSISAGEKLAEKATDTRTQILNNEDSIAVSEDETVGSPVDAVIEWGQFTAMLSSLQREALLTLTGGNGGMTMQQLAAANGTMPELLIDEINELAMDIIGDLLIDGEEISEEYVPMLYILRGDPLR